MLKGFRLFWQQCFRLSENVVQGVFLLLLRTREGLGLGVEGIEGSEGSEGIEGIEGIDEID